MRPLAAMDTRLSAPLAAKQVERVQDRFWGSASSSTSTARSRSARTSSRYAFVCWKEWSLAEAVEQRPGSIQLLVTEFARAQDQ